jgi:hypothetical protein
MFHPGARHFPLPFSPGAAYYLNDAAGAIIGLEYDKVY